MTIYDATEQAYKNGYEKGYVAGQRANSIICNGCVCMPVCCVYRATGGVMKCNHCHCHKENEIDVERTNLS